MKRLNGDDKEEKGKKKTQIYYSREFQTMLDVGEAVELGIAVADKKRRLSSDQVKALEKNFDVENKLEPERKSQLAGELGLQPRQVAIWFQNRRARLKTKQLEKDYGLLKADYRSLKLDFDNLEQESQALLAEVRELKLKFHPESADSNVVLFYAAAVVKGGAKFPASESVTNGNAVVINGVDNILGDARKEDSTTQYEDGKVLFQQNSSSFFNWIQFSNSTASGSG